MKIQFPKAAIALFGFLAMSGPGLAQNEATKPYGQVKGWTVVKIIDANGAFKGCRAVKSERGSALWLIMRQVGWRIAVPTRQGGRFGGAVLSIDKADIDSQFGFSNGIASRDVGQDVVQRLRQGRHVAVHINGDRPLSWSLDGSAAAMLKVQECYDRQGKAGHTQQAQQAVKPAKKSRRARPDPQVFQRSIPATCDTPTSGRYECTGEIFAPPKGYQQAIRVDHVFGSAPSYYFHVLSDTQSEAWVSIEGEPYIFVGVWVSAGRQDPCASPRPRQGPKARKNLGQDAWQLCVHPK